MKKLLALLIALLMVLSVLASCGGGKADGNTDTSTSESVSDSESDSASDSESDSESESVSDSESDSDSESVSDSESTSDRESTSDSESTSDIESDSDSDSESEVKKTVILFQKDIESPYTLIYHTNLSSLLKSACKGVEYQLEQKFGIDVAASPLFEGYEDIDQKNTEILIGDTKREESIAVAEELLKGIENEYAIKLLDNGKLVIVASSDDALTAAINFFTETFIKTATDVLEIEEGYTVYQELEGTPRPEWLLAKIPEYTKGVLAEKVYEIGTNITLSPSQKAGRMHIISETNADEFNEYLELLETEGFTEIARTENNGNIYVQYLRPNSTKTLYVYFLEALGEVRVINDTVSVPETDFEYTCEDGTAVYYQYGMMHDPGGAGAGQNSAGKYGNNGAFDIIKLADNKLILIDGGGEPQVTAETTAALVNFLFEITNTPEDGQVTVAAWFFTHTHGDHYQFINKLVTEYKDKFIFERVMHNIPASTVTGYPTELQNFGTALSSAYKESGIKFVKLHTGQNIKLGNISFDVIMTHEDAVDPVTGKSFIIDENNTSTVLKFHINGKSVMYFGDWGGNDQSTQEKVDEYKEMERRLMEVYKVVDNDGNVTYPTLKADISQIAHHSINDWMGNVYTAIAPDYAFFSQADVPYEDFFYPCYKNIIRQLRAAGIEDRNIFFAGRQTNWLEITTNGEITHGFRQIEGAEEAVYYYYVNAEGKTLYKDGAGRVTTEIASDVVLISDLSGTATFEGMLYVDGSAVTDFTAVPKSYWDCLDDYASGRSWIEWVEEEAAKTE